MSQNAIFASNSMRMKELSIFKQLDIAMLPVMEHTLVFENEFMLADNFGTPADMVDTSEFVSPAYPFKVNFTLLLFCTQGEMRLRANLQEVCLTAGHVLVVSPGTIGECLEISADCQVAMIAYVGHHYEQGADMSLSIQFQKYLTHQLVLAILPEEMEESLAIYRAMRRKVEQTDYEFTREALNGYMQVLFSNGKQWMSRYTKEKGSRTEEAGNRQQQLFDRFLELVQKHYREEKGIAYYAARMCITPKYLSQAVHKASGRHAGDWIRDYVILEAKALLKSQAYTVQQISDLLNFANPSFFGKYFRAAVGCSPRKYMLE